jgi:apolipoprotein N-acyltransferase
MSNLAQLFKFLGIWFVAFVVALVFMWSPALLVRAPQIGVNPLDFITLEGVR